MPLPPYCFFPQWTSSLVPLFQNESKCETFHMKMSSTCRGSFSFICIHRFNIRLAPWADKMNAVIGYPSVQYEAILPARDYPLSPARKISTKDLLTILAGYWPRSFFTCLWTPTPSRSINTQKKNLANIQLCWPHTWSITHTYQMIQSRLLLQSSLCVAESYLSLISAVLSLIRQNTFVEKSVFLL